MAELRVTAPADTSPCVRPPPTGIRPFAARGGRFTTSTIFTGGGVTDSTPFLSISTAARRVDRHVRIDVHRFDVLLTVRNN